MTIEGPDVNHIKNVLRMKAGEEMLVSDGTGRDYLCVLEGVGEQEGYSQDHRGNRGSEGTFFQDLAVSGASQGG